jgi:mersacidin/lichenicidin family type 2 lantibiotic
MLSSALQGDSNAVRNISKKGGKMAAIDLIRAWKDPSYRASLSSEDLKGLPDHPSGIVDLTDEQLRSASGVAGVIVTTFKTCTEYTFRRFHCCN